MATRTPRQVGLGLSMAVSILASTVAAQGFQSGDLYVVSGSLDTPLGLSPGITRVDPFFGTATLVRSLYDLSSNAVYDPFRAKLIFRGAPTIAGPFGLWGVDAAGNATILSFMAGSTANRVSAVGDGRIYFVNDSNQLRYFDAANVVHDVLDAAGAGVFNFGPVGTVTITGFHYDAATNAIRGAWTEAGACSPADILVPHAMRVPLTPSGNQVSGPTTSVTICIPNDGGGGDYWVPNTLSRAPGGKVFLSCDNNNYVQGGRFVLIDPLTMSTTTYATTTPYFGSPAANDGCYSFALGRGVLVDTFNNAVRAFTQGTVGEGAIVASGGVVSSSGGSGETTFITEIPFGIFGGLVNYGTGTAGCAGPEVMGANSAPKAGAANFRLTTTGAPANSLGLGLVGNAADFAGSDPFSIGVLCHIDFFLSTEILSLDLTSNPLGLAETLAAIPLAPGLVGLTYYVQSLWVWTGCTTPSPFNFSSSNGLAITIQP